jgi:hypothetical protein
VGQLGLQAQLALELQELLVLLVQLAHLAEEEQQAQELMPCSS